MMTSDSTDRLYLVVPPYRNLQLLETSDPIAAVPAGSALLWAMSPEADDGLLARIAARPWGMALICVLPPAENLATLELAHRMVERCHPSSILPYHRDPSAVDVATLVRIPPENLAHAVTDYMAWRGLLMEPDVRRIARRAIAAAPRHPSVSEFARSLYMSRRALGRRFVAAGIPVPSHWLHMGRILEAVLRLQDPEQGLHEVARAQGYADGFSLSKQMRRLTRFCPTDARQRAGWHWLVEAWLRTEAEEGRLAPAVTASLLQAGPRFPTDPPSMRLPRAWAGGDRRALRAAERPPE